MRLLSIETSSFRGSLALCEIKNNQVIEPLEKSWEKQSSHSEVISETLLDLLKSKSWTLKELTHISVGIGPGSFTGIRVGLNFAKSLAYGLNLPILGVDSLEAMARSPKQTDLPILCIVNAFKNQIFASIFETKNQVLKVSTGYSSQVIEPSKLETWIQHPHLCRGDAFELYKADFSQRLRSSLIREPAPIDSPTALGLVDKVVADARLDHFTLWKSVNPLYIRGASAEEKLKGGALKPLPRF